MERPKTAAITLTILYGILVAMVAESYPRLPGRIASHFSASGRPDGWTSRPGYAASVLLGAGLLAVLCGGATYLTRYLPDSSVNIPNRGYWLAPERRRRAHGKLFAFGLWLGCLLVVFFAALHVLIVRANRAAPARLPAKAAAGLMGAFLIGILGLICYFGAFAWRVDDRDRRA